MEKALNKSQRTVVQNNPSGFDNISASEMRSNQLPKRISPTVTRVVTEEERLLLLIKQEYDRLVRRLQVAQSNEVKDDDLHHFEGHLIECHDDKILPLGTVLKFKI